MSDRGLVRAAAFRSLWRSAPDLIGPQATVLLERAGVPRDMQPDAMISWEMGVQLLEDLARVGGRDDFAIQFAKQVPWADLGVLGYVVLNAPTLGAAFAHMRRYFVIQQRAGVFSLDVEGGSACLAYTLRRSPHELPRQHALAILTMLVRVVREGTGDASWAPSEITLPHRPPTGASDALAFFGAPIRYGAEAAALGFPADMMRRPMVTADPGLFPILVRHADEVLATLPAADDTTLDQIRRLVSSLLGNGTISIDAVAARMGTSARTIQRQLQLHGASFKQLVDDVRLGMARRHLADPSVNLTDAAFLLGYSDLSAFSRAFRRWTGSSPQEYRDTQLADASR
jgi:AraC-like DNA-binding protein